MITDVSPLCDACMACAGVDLLVQTMVCQTMETGSLSEAQISSTIYQFFYVCELPTSPGIGAKPLIGYSYDTGEEDVCIPPRSITNMLRHSRTVEFACSAGQDSMLLLRLLLLSLRNRGELRHRCDNSAIIWS